MALAPVVPERWSASWENCLALAHLADAAHLDFMLPIGRWKGYGGETDFHGETLETIVLRDVTTVGKDREMLCAREAHLRLIVEQMPAILWTTDKRLRITSTLGGLRIDERARVAPGLYACGADAGGIATGGYASGLAAALVLGRVAAESALEER